MTDSVELSPGLRVAAEEVTELNGDPVAAQKVQRIALVAVTADGQAQDIGTVTSPIPVTLTGDDLLDLENVTVTIDPASLAALEEVTVSLDSASLAALESVTATGPLTDTQLRTSPVPVDSSTADGVLAGDGTKNVTTAGTRVALAASTACKWVIVSARPANTGKIVVGTVTCVAAAGSERGTILAAGQSAAIPATNLASVYIDATVNGEGVAFAYGA